MADKKVKIRISLDGVRRVIGGIRRVGSALRTVGKVAGKTFSLIRRVGRTAMIGVAAGVGILGLAVKKAFDVERYVVQFKAFLGNIKAAKEMYAALNKFSVETPFEPEEIMQAAKQLMTYGTAADQVQDTIRMLGDVSAMTGTELAMLTKWYGRFVSQAGANKSVEAATTELSEMGAITSKTRMAIVNLNKSGANGKAMLAALHQGLRRAKGSMADLSKTGHGLWSTLKGAWSDGLATFGGALAEVAKDGIGELIEVIAKLKSTGALKRWGEDVAAAARSVMDVIKGLAAGGQQRKEAVGLIKQAVKDALEFMITGAVKVGIAIGKAIVDYVSGRIGKAVKDPFGTGKAAMGDFQQSSGSLKGRMKARGITNATYSDLQGEFNRIGQDRAMANTPGVGFPTHQMAMAIVNALKAQE